MDLSGKYQMDGKDLWTAYNVFIEGGSDDFLKYPAKKDSITHDWQDSNGIDMDLSRVFVTSRDITLQCAIVTDTGAQFWAKYTGFIKDLTQPGTRRITVTRWPGQSFAVAYKDCGSFSQMTPVMDGNVRRIACKFTLVLTEPEPKLEGGDIFIVDEEGRFLVT